MRNVTHRLVYVNTCSPDGTADLGGVMEPWKVQPCWGNISLEWPLGARSLTPFSASCLQLRYDLLGFLLQPLAAMPSP